MESNNYHIMPLKKPYFDYIKNGTKRYELRINSGMMTNIKIGDVIKFVNGNENYIVYVIQIEKYNSFKDALLSHPLEKILPNAKDINDGIKIYNDIPTYTEKSQKYGVLLFKILRPTGVIHKIPILNPPDCPTFDLIKAGTKVVEGRKYSEKYRNIKKGDKILFINGNAKCMVVVVYINNYKTIEDYLTNETLERALPCVTNIKDAINIYNKWTTPEERNKLLKENGYSFIGIGIQLIN